MRVRPSPLVLLALSHIAAAVKLSDFLPRLENLSPACDAIYTSLVSGCQGSDFTNGAICSTTCISGLQEMTDAVKAACGNQDLEGSNVIAAYLADQGPQTLCHNAQAVLAAESSSSAAGASTSSPSDTTSAPPSSTTTTTSSSSSSLASSLTTSSTSSASTNTSTNTSDPGLSNTAAVSLTPATSSSSTTAAKPAQSSADDGTRGSDPFNTQDDSNGGSTISATLSVGMLTIGMLVLALR
nr:hypothetical protein CFP56_02982 [Quercus suber]